MNRHRFKSDMEAAWELRPGTDATPESHSHPHRFRAPSKPSGKSNPKQSEAAAGAQSPSASETPGDHTP